MQRILLSTFLALILAAFAGCASNCCDQSHGCHVSPGACDDKACCDGHGCCHGGQGCQGGPGCAAQGAGGNGYVSYPYYTVRGPRDFLETNPQSIGP